MIPAIYNYLKYHRPSSGVIDFAKLGGEIINYMVSSGVISSYDKKECQEYLAYLISLAFPNGLPTHVIQEVLRTIQQQSSYSFEARAIYNSL